jgi:glucose/arabinose dehydrogenase
MHRNARVLTSLTTLVATLGLGACALPGESSLGPVQSPASSPIIGATDEHLIPAVQIAPVTGWSKGDMPNRADYLTSVEDAAFYGFPWSYDGQHVDTRVDPPKPDTVARAIAPDHALGALGAHVAALGLASAGATALPQHFANGVFIGERGSWNRKPPVDYKVVFVPFSAGHPSGMPSDVLTGFVDSAGQALGRPVGASIDRSSALLVADDVGNMVRRATADARPSL